MFEWKAFLNEQSDSFSDFEESEKKNQERLKAEQAKAKKDEEEEKPSKEDFKKLLEAKLSKGRPEPKKTVPIVV